MASVVLGTAELVRKLHELPVTLRDRGTRLAMASAAKPVVRSTKAMAPQLTGLLRQSIGSKISKPSGKDAVAYIGPKHLKVTKKRKKAGFKPSAGVRKRARRAGVDLTTADPARYAHLVEFGHRTVSGGSLKSGKGRFTGGFLRRTAAHFGGGRVGARPFMVPGLNAASAAAEGAIRQTLTDFIEREGGK